MRTKILFSFISVFYSMYAGCGVPDIFDERVSEQQQSQAPTIFVEITNQSQDVWQRLSIDSDGIAVLSNMLDGQKMKVRLSEVQLSKLEQTFERNRFDNFEGSYEDALTAGGLRSEISYTDAGATKTVVTEHIAAPAGLQNILSGIADTIVDIKRLTPELQLHVNHIRTGSYQGYELRLTACNRSETDRVLRFNNGKLFDFTISTANLSHMDSGTVVWDWGEDLFFPDGTSELKLPPGHCQTYTVNWNGNSLAGGPVNGNFWVTANLHSIPGGSPAQQRIDR